MTRRTSVVFYMKIYISFSVRQISLYQKRPMRRRAKSLNAVQEGREKLDAMARSQSLPATLSRRAQMILRMAGGATNSSLLRRFQYSRPAVTFWRSRRRERGISALHKEFKPGRPRSTADEKVALLINKALCNEAKGQIHCKQRGLTMARGLPTTTVHRYMTLFWLRLHRFKSCKFSTEPFFIENVRDIVGLYLKSPDHAIVLFVDEKTKVQTLEPTQYMLPAGLCYVEDIRTSAYAMAQRPCVQRHRHRQRDYKMLAAEQATGNRRLPSSCRIARIRAPGLELDLRQLRQP
jgi:hypothetical protein